MQRVGRRERQVGVDARAGHRAGSGEVGDDPAVADGHGQLHPDRLGVRAEVVDVIGELVAPGGNGVDVLPHGQMRALEEFVGRRPVGLQAEPVDEFADLGGAHHVGVELTPQIADDLIGNADVGGDQIQHLADGLALGEVLDRQDPDPLLMDVDDADDGLAAGRRSADVDVVGGDDREADDLVAVEDRRDGEDVREVTRVHGRVVDQEGVARPHLLGRVRRQHTGDGGGARAEMSRRVVAGAEHLARGVEHRRRAVLALAHGLGEGGAAQRPAHLLGDRHDASGHDGEGERIHRHDAASTDTTRFCHSSTVADAPGGMTVVDSRSCTIAGPAMPAPGLRR